jgi:hypothetical protein
MFKCLKALFGKPAPVKPESNACMSSEVLSMVVFRELKKHITDYSPFDKVTTEQAANTRTKIDAYWRWTNNLRDPKVRDSYRRWLNYFERNLEEAETNTKKGEDPGMRAWQDKTDALFKRVRECEAQGTVPKIGQLEKP